MPRPTVRDVHLEQALTQFSIGYKNETYIAPMVFPNLRVEKQSDYYFVFEKSAWFRDIVAKRAPGTRAARADYQISTASYICVNYALAKAVPDEVRANADNPLRPDTEATEFISDALLRGQEIRVANLVMAASGASWAYAASPATQWSSSSADPLGDIEAAVNGIISTIGRQPNVAVMSWDVWRYLKNHPDLAERVKYTRPGGTPVPDDVAAWFNLDRVLIGTAIKDTSVEGASTAVMSYVWGDGFWLGYVTPRPGLQEPTAGYSLEWMNREVRRFREDQERQDILEGSHYTDEVVTASDAGAMIYDAV